MKTENAFVEVNNTSLFYTLDASRARRPVILMHPFGMSHRVWDPYLDLVAKFKLYRYDMRGFGLSSLPDPKQPYTHADDLLALLDYLDLDKVRIVAPSMAGNVALEFAAQHPHRVAALALLSPSLNGHMWNTTELFFQAGPERVKALGMDGVKREFLAQRLLSESMAHDAVRAVVEREFAQYSGWHFYGDDPLERREPNTIERLDALRDTPTMIVNGAREMRDYLQIADEISAKIPAAQRHVLDGAGHLTFLEQIEPVKALVIDFLLAAK